MWFCVRKAFEQRKIKHIACVIIFIKYQLFYLCKKWLPVYGSTAICRIKLNIFCKGMAQINQLSYGLFINLNITLCQRFRKTFMLGSTFSFKRMFNIADFAHSQMFVPSLI